MRKHLQHRACAAAALLAAVNLTGCGGGGGDVTVDTTPSTGVIAFSGASFSVGEAGASVTITVNRSGGTSGAASVQFATSNGTATAGQDYTSASGTLSWAAGESSAKTFNVAIINDIVDEPGETVTLTLSNTTGASLGTPGVAVLTISDDDPPGTSGTIFGGAVKGIIRNAIVELFQFDPQGNQVPMGSGVTDANGNYNISYSGYQGSVVLVVVRARRSGDPAGPATTVVCDLSDANGCGPNVNLGDEIEVPLSFELQTCLPEPPADGVPAPVTPFTDIVVRRAEERAQNQQLQENVRTALLNAASEVAQLLGGVDVLRLQAINVADPAAVNGATPQQLTYSALVAAVAGVASDGSTPVDFSAAVETLAQQFTNGQIQAGDLRDLVAEAQEQLLGLGQQDQSGLLQVINDQANAADPDGDGVGTVNPEPNADASNPAISRAKNAVQEVRNTAQSLQDLQNPARAFGDQLELVNESTSSVGDSLFNSLALSVESAAAFFEASNGADGTQALNTVDDAQQARSATISIATAGGNTTVSVVGEVRNETVNLSVIFPQDPGQSAATMLMGMFTDSNIFTRGSAPGLRLSVSEGTAEVVKTNTDPLTLQNLDSVDFDLVARLEQINVTDPVSLQGTLRAVGVRCTAQSCTQTEAELGPQFNPESLEIEGRASNGGNSARQSVTGALSNARSFNPSLDVSSTNVPQGSVTITSDVALQGAPATVVTLAAALNAIGPDPDRVPVGTVSLTLTRASSVVLGIVLSNSTENPTAASLVITTASGVQLTIIDDDVNSSTSGVVGTVSVDGQQVGTIQQLSSGLVVVRYNDGTFETLFN